MRSRLATRPARLILAATAAVALTATMTACEDDSATPAAPSTGGSDGGSDSDGADDTTDEDAPGSGHEGEPVTQGCGTTDLTFTLTEESQYGGYFLVAAQANEGITCTLEVTNPDVFFGSSEESHASAIESGSGSFELSGDTIAYVGINPKTTNDDNGIEFEQVFLGIAGEDGANAEEFPISATLIDEPIVSNWTLDPSDLTGYMGG
ncbi:hypothetical protein [Streptomyces xiamenensis]|jgi:hypothetical protein|uniref:hypothetical protein n=1 Tax=Streptomyces xiamenensis TaxID=408015 RepID=UPI0037CDE6CB